jgi:hypothetical protein
LGIGFGTLPPSPFTGTPTTLIAVRIGTETVEIDPKVVSALEQLRAWNPHRTVRRTAVVSGIPPQC